MTNLYSFYKNMLKGESLPCAVLHLELFYRNIEHIARRAGGKQVRIASKSLRCVHALRYILETGSPFSGIMTYSGKETLYLAEMGFNNLLLGYPLTSLAVLRELAQLVKNGKQVCFMADCAEHLNMLNKVGKETGCAMPVCIDYDLSNHYPGLHFGVWRSGINTLQKLERLLDELKKFPFVHLEGLMGYEAQVAGIGDTVYGKGLKSLVVQQLKKKAIRLAEKNRAAAVELIHSRGHNLRFVNGGGTGSMETTAREKVVTEITAGSGFFNGHLFDNYKAFQPEPALLFALEIVRMPNKNTYTCFGGGYIASGATGKEKLPEVYLPEHGLLDAQEGAGEVQTPIRFTQIPEPLALGDPVFLRHAKSGELCERFNEIVVIAQNELYRVPTYRGSGYSFG
ncbi:MAG: alanine racemase [Dinghuibacter sp.]|nr:alanine racemase [Dinghuibacter sp.]